MLIIASKEHFCTLVLRISHNSDGHHREEVFCEFKNSLAKLTGYYNNEKLVQGDFLRKFEKGDLKSGRSSLSTRHAQLSKDMSYMRLLNADDPSSLAMDITTDEDLGINIFTSTYHQPKKEAVTGDKKVLVLRVLTNNGQQEPPSDEDTLSDKWFGTGGDLVNNKSQFEACSNGKLLFEPYVGTTSTGVVITNGVYTITVQSDRLNPSGVENDARSAINTILGGQPGQFDYVALSVPNNDEGYAAYAYVNGWLSLYTDSYADQVTVQMHEIGHNLGLAHSGEGSSTYGDTSGNMGASFSDDMYMCFNAVKNAQLGWYSDRLVDVSNGYTGALHGIADYRSTQEDAKMILKLPDPGNNLDYYISFNKATGINSGTREGINQVLVHSRRAGNGYATSLLVAKLSARDSYNLAPLDITVQSIGNSASVAIGEAPSSPTPPPVAKPTTTKSPSPSPVAKPTTTKPPTSNEGCYEDSKAQFLFENKRGKVKTRRCKQLRNILTYDSDVCNSDISNEDFLPVKDVCQVSCKNCPGGCAEVSFDRFFFKTKEDGDVKTMRCAHLKRKSQKISAEKLQEICSREAPSGYSNGNFVCPITCGVCA